MARNSFGDGGTFRRYSSVRLAASGGSFTFASTSASVMLPSVLCISIISAELNVCGRALSWGMALPSIASTAMRRSSAVGTDA